MSGLSLRTGISAGGAFTPSGSYTPMSPASATAPTSGRLSIAQQAYGINGTGAADVSPLPGVGSVVVGVLALAGLVYLWWSLPR
jgi:hypothetical protein